MNKFMIWGTLLIAASLTACNSEDGTESSYITPVSFSGTYTLGGDCAAPARTLSISETSVRLTETVCNIGKIKGLNTSSTIYELTACRSGAGEEADRAMTISEVEDGMVEISGWSGQNLIFETCG